MTIQRNFEEYHKSISNELTAVQNRVRNLIGNKHWETDGEHKESVLRKILRLYLPETLRIGNGFVCCRESNSTQIDVLISDISKPTLFKDNDFAVVTSDVVKSIIEVKTRLDSRSDLRRILKTLADNAESLRRDSNTDCRIGLFVYQDTIISNEDILRALKEDAKSGFDDRRAINWISIGKDKFFRYWELGSLHAKNENTGTVWRSYKLKDMAQAYFVSNVVWETSPRMPEWNEPFWFPIEGGKEQHCTHYIRFKGNEGPQSV